ncbi:NADP-dependent oxidoreductase [Nocardiopsis changdeensis]|uniref:NADP-dependent oxidoreductase n=1 Tax=Nocardiopsis changdeensis TaxID=2831969 RepID=A0ABX8BTD1_9ACTN|nr:MULTISPECIES: NADP-dependent oxidoreductase [Nocardiopsis]QUX25272.1 NADP-dependent oxidoreductase [Nocardiopsis changdeensis]QYX35659.1 NADP-dependent oxidoreductase [Nocardiopsis sp. MT53]
MRAVRYERYGGPEVLAVADGLPTPPVGAADVRVEVAAAAVGGGEAPIRAGRLRRVLRQRFPAGTGVDFVGTVVQAGPAVTRAGVGDAVWGVMPHGTFGALAESVVVPQERVAAAPRSVPAHEAAALPSSGTTALHALTRRVRLERGQRLLVRGAAGGVGVVAVQLGASLGAHVTALAGADHLSWLGGLGAAEALDHRTTDLGGLGRFDVVLDLVGTRLSELRGLLVRGGVLVPLALDPARPIRSALWTAAAGLDRRTRIAAFSNDPSPRELEELAELVDRGAVAPVVAAVLEMDDVVRAHRMLERGGVRGKIVLTP